MERGAVGKRSRRQGRGTGGVVVDIMGFVGRERLAKRTTYLVSGSFVGDILRVAVDVVHGVGLGRDVFLGGAGGGGVMDLVCHIDLYGLDSVCVSLGVNLICLGMCTISKMWL